MMPWFDVAFGEWYLDLYPHRNLEEARRALASLDGWIPRTGPILDVGCGKGRHMIALEETGRTPVGLDRSWALLREAAGNRDLLPALVRGDMRHLPFAGNTFAAVLSMFTSFGYFGSRRAHRDLLTEFRRVAIPGGRLVLDYLNAPVVRSGLIPHSVRIVRGDHEVDETRTIRSTDEGDVVIKHLVIRDARGAEVLRYEEAVSLYDRDEITELLDGSGWEQVAAFGDYAGHGWTPETDRLVMVAERRSDP